MISKIVFMMILLFVGNSLVIGQTHSKKIEGVYELISIETAVFTSNKIDLFPVQKEIIAFPEWSGLWIIKERHYSFVRARQHQARLQENITSEFYAVSGRYTFEKDKLIFYEDFSVNPLYKGRPVIMNYKLDNQYLTLVQKITPTLEDNREGELIIKLRKLP